MQGKGTTDAIFMVIQLHEKYMQREESLFLLEKAFDGMWL